MEDYVWTDPCSTCWYKKGYSSGITWTITASSGDEYIVNPAKDGYKELFQVLIDALNRAQNGKGAQRHQRSSEPFVEQPIMQITNHLGEGFPLGQAVKKIFEVEKLDTVEDSVNELLDAINYIAAAVLYLRNMGEQEDESKS